MLSHNGQQSHQATTTRFHVPRSGAKPKRCALAHQDNETNQPWDVHVSGMVGFDVQWWWWSLVVVVGGCIITHCHSGPRVRQEATRSKYPTKESEHTSMGAETSLVLRRTRIVRSARESGPTCAASLARESKRRGWMNRAGMNWTSRIGIDLNRDISPVSDSYCHFNS